MKYMVSMRQDNRDMKACSGVDEVEAHATFKQWCAEVERNMYPGFVSVNIKPMTQVHWNSILYNSGVKV